MLHEINRDKFVVRQMDGAEGMLLLPDKSIKLIYGSPPYPNAERDYGVWRSSEYIAKMTPFLDAACLKLTDDGFIVINVILGIASEPIVRLFESGLKMFA